MSSAGVVESPVYAIFKMNDAIDKIQLPDTYHVKQSTGTARKPRAAVMAPIPLTLVGILPAHALIGAFFTATSMMNIDRYLRLIARALVMASLALGSKEVAVAESQASGRLDTG